jgi:transcriptional regulator with XRE-family HTH domain
VPGQADGAKKAFGIRLRDYRRDAGLNGKQLAAELGWHPSKVTKIEHGRQNPTEADVRAWATACGVARYIPELIAALREVHQMWTEWRRELRLGQRHIQASGTPMYERTRLLRAYESATVPGILQVRPYVRAAREVTAALFDLPTDDLEEATEARLSRQYLLTTGPNHFDFVIEAGALGVALGDAQGMGEQYAFLDEVTRMPKVNFGIIPPAPPPHGLRRRGILCLRRQASP